MTWFEFRPNSLRAGAARGMQAAALALIVILAMPAKGVEDRAVKMRVAPIYPEIAKRMKITGAVHLEAIVDPDGKVADVKTVSGNRMLAPAAEDAVRKWKFAPAAAGSTVEVEVNFGLSQ